MSNIATVHAIYGAFATGDIPAILSYLAEDVAWEPDSVDHGIPWLRPGRGKPHVAAFFEAVGAGLEMQRFEPLNFLEGGNQVAAVINVTAVAKATGKTVTDVELHLWTFGSDGKVTALRHFLDTAQHAAAIRAG